MLSIADMLDTGSETGSPDPDNEEGGYHARAYTIAHAEARGPHGQRDLSHETAPIAVRGS